MLNGNNVYRIGEGEKGERKEEKSGEKNCFPEGRVGKGKVSSYHRWIHLVRTRYE